LRGPVATGIFSVFIVNCLIMSVLCSFLKTTNFYNPLINKERAHLTLIVMIWSYPHFEGRVGKDWSLGAIKHKELTRWSMLQGIKWWTKKTVN